MKASFIIISDFIVFSSSDKVKLLLI